MNDAQVNVFHFSKADVSNNKNNEPTMDFWAARVDFWFHGRCQQLVWWRHENRTSTRW